MRLLVVTARFPSADRPAAGTFVRERLAGTEARVIAPDRYDQPGWRRYARLLWHALTARGRFDGVEGHFVLPTGPIALLAARLRGIPLVLYAHGSDVRSQARRSPLHRWLASRALRGARHVVTNSTDTAAHVRALAPELEPEVIPPGVDLGRFSPSPRPAQRRVLYLGGTAEGKGYDVARKIADTLLGPGIREVSPEAIPAILAEHDVLLVPSADEGFGLVAAEAIASGRWVVAADTGGLRQVVRPGVDGTLVADGDFAAALASMPDYDPEAVAAGAGRFSLERNRQAMDRAWRRLLGDERG